MCRFLKWLMIPLTLGLGTGALDAFAKSASSLSQAAMVSHRLVGSEVEAKLLRSDPTYVSIVRREFNVVVPQNEMKFGWVSRKRGEYDFTDADFIVDFAQKNRMKVRGTTLAWHRNYPRWLWDTNFSGDELKKILLEHIATEVGHFAFKFPGRVFVWDVVNEAIGPNGKPRPETIWSKIGQNPGDYIPLAFQAARKADPTSELFYNDYGIEEVNSKSDAVYELLKSLKAGGVPIDGIGFQMHIGFREPLQMDSVRKNMERFSKLGLKIQITEFDYLLPNNPSQELLERQARAYHDAAALCVSTPACEAFLSWGFTDAHSWIPDFFPGYGSALYFDEKYQPKPAYQGLLSGLLLR